MNCLNSVCRIENVSLTSSGRASPDIDTGSRAAFKENDRAACGTPALSEMADTDSSYIGDGSGFTQFNCAGWNYAEACGDRASE